MEERNSLNLWSENIKNLEQRRLTGTDDTMIGSLSAICLLIAGVLQRTADYVYELEEKNSTGTYDSEILQNFNDWSEYENLAQLFKLVCGEDNNIYYTLFASGLEQDAEELHMALFSKALDKLKTIKLPR